MHVVHATDINTACSCTTVHAGSLLYHLTIIVMDGQPTLRSATVPISPDSFITMAFQGAALGTQGLAREVHYHSKLDRQMYNLRRTCTLHFVRRRSNRSGSDVLADSAASAAAWYALCNPSCGVDAAPLQTSCCVSTEGHARAAACPGDPPLPVQHWVDAAARGMAARGATPRDTCNQQVVVVSL